MRERQLAPKLVTIFGERGGLRNLPFMTPKSTARPIGKAPPRIFFFFSARSVVGAVDEGAGRWYSL
jgi:hypothetical protein